MKKRRKKKKKKGPETVVKCAESDIEVLLGSWDS